MMAMRNTAQDQQPGEIEALLPWHAAGTLNARDTRRVDEALAADPDLARQYQAIREEYAETILLNESLGVPSSRAMQKLFAAIDAEPAQVGSASHNLSRRLAGFFASLSPRTLMASAAIGALALVLQAGVIGSIVMQRNDARFDSAASETGAQPGAPASVTRSIAPASPAEAGPRVLVRFTPAAKVSDITALLDTYQATIVDGGKAGLFRLQLGRLPMTKEQIAGWVERLQNEKIVSSVAAAP
jgi:anti-sigma factor RsiW